MKRLAKILGTGVGWVLVTVGSLASLGVWIATTAHFFRNDNGFLGLVSLFVPPAELVLAWVVSSQFGLMSVVSILCLMFGGITLGLSE